MHEQVIMEEKAETERNKNSGSKLLSHSAKSNTQINATEEKKDREKTMSSKQPSIVFSDKKIKERNQSAKNLKDIESKSLGKVSKQEHKEKKHKIKEKEKDIDK